MAEPYAALLLFMEARQRALEDELFELEEERDMAMAIADATTGMATAAAVAADDAYNPTRHALPLPRLVQRHATWHVGALLRLPQGGIHAAGPAPAHPHGRLSKDPRRVRVDLSMCTSGPLHPRF